MRSIWEPFAELEAVAEWTPLEPVVEEKVDQDSGNRDVVPDRISDSGPLPVGVESPLQGEKERPEN